MVPNLVTEFKKKMISIKIHECSETSPRILHNDELLKVDCESLIQSGAQQTIQTIKNIIFTKKSLNTIHIVFNQSSSSIKLLLFLVRITFFEIRSELCDCSSPMPKLEGVLGLGNPNDYGLYIDPPKNDAFFMGYNTIIEGERHNQTILTSLDIRDSPLLNIFKKKRRRGGKNKKWFMN